MREQTAEFLCMNSTPEVNGVSPCLKVPHSKEDLEAQWRAQPAALWAAGGSRAVCTKDIVLGGVYPELLG